MPPPKEQPGLHGAVSWFEDLKNLPYIDTAAKPGGSNGKARRVDSTILDEHQPGSVAAQLVMEGKVYRRGKGPSPLINCFYGPARPKGHPGTPVPRLCPAT